MHRPGVVIRSAAQSGKDVFVHTLAVERVGLQLPE
jgi:hypothetical protein